MDVSVDRDASPATRAENHCKDHPFARAGPIGCFRYRQAIGIICATYLAAERQAQIPVEGPPVHPHGVGIFYGMRYSRNGPGYANARLSPGARVRLRSSGRPLRWPGRFPHSRRAAWVYVAVEFAAFLVEGYELNFRTPEIDPNGEVFDSL